MQLAYIRQLTKRTVRLGRVKPQLALEPDLSPDQFGDLTDRKLDTRTYINMCIPDLALLLADILEIHVFHDINRSVGQYLMRLINK